MRRWDEVLSDAVRADLGHARGSDMLFRHYRAAVSPAAAAEFWAIRLRGEAELFGAL